MKNIDIIAPIFKAGLESEKPCLQVIAEIDSAIGYDTIDPDSMEHISFRSSGIVEVDVLAFADQGYALARFLHESANSPWVEGAGCLSLRDLLGNETPIVIAEDNGVRFYQYGGDGIWAEPEHILDLSWFDESWVEVFEDDCWASRETRDLRAGDI